METCVILAAQQRTQYVSSSVKGGFTSPSSNCFTDISCRNFDYATGLLPTPSKTFTFSSSNSSHIATNPKSVPIPIKTKGYDNGLNCREFAYSELWAGPAYCNSPPPSSVPIPKFSSMSKPTRSVSLDLPVVYKEVIEMHPLAMSAPSSPREAQFSTKDLFGTADSATMALRRILNLDMCDG